MRAHRVFTVFASVIGLLVTSWLVAPTPAVAAGTVTVVGSTITYTGTADVDSIRVDTYSPQCVAGTRCVRISSLVPGSQLNEVGPCKRPSAGEPNILACSMTAVTTVVINLGAGNDAYLTDPSSMDRSRIHHIRVTGGDGNDAFTGGGAAEEFSGENGNDLIIPDAGSLPHNMYTDLVSGGPGIDTVDYRPSLGAPSGVDVSLDDQWNDGTRVGADGDNIRSDVEMLILTPGPDTFVGTSAAETVWAGAGNDQIDGGPGKDLLFGEGGDDTLIGGAGFDQVFGDNPATPELFGNDNLIVADGEADEATCGLGEDRVEADPADFINDGCEITVTTNPPPQPVSATLAIGRPVLKANKSRKKAKIALRCSGGLACEGSVVVRSVAKSKRIAGKGKLASGRFSLAADTNARATVKLNRKARKVLRRTKRAAVRIVLKVDASGARVKAKVRLHR